MNGTKIEIRTKDGVADAYVSHPAGEGPWPSVLYFMDGLGWRPTLFEMADRLASNGYYVLLPNMYWRSGALPPFDLKSVFSGGPERERMMKIVGAVTDENATRDTESFLAFLAGNLHVKGAHKVACAGYCLGGGLAVSAACAFPNTVAAAASFHGGRFLTSPAAPEAIAKKARARFYLGVAEIDANHTPEVTKRLTAAFEEAKAPYTIELYAGVSHGFVMPDLPVYDRDASERHWDRLLKLLRETFA
ncbi:MAG: dienelactone hydrolase family protein [Spirochaetia bacterium]